MVTGRDDDIYGEHGVWHVILIFGGYTLMACKRHTSATEFNGSIRLTARASGKKGNWGKNIMSMNE